MGIKIKDLTNATTIANPGNTDLPISTGGSTYKIQVQDIIDIVPLGVTVISGATTIPGVRTLTFTGGGNLIAGTAAATIDIPTGGGGGAGGGISNIQIQEDGVLKVNATTLNFKGGFDVVVGSAGAGTADITSVVQIPVSTVNTAGTTYTYKTSAAGLAFTDSDFIITTPATNIARISINPSIVSSITGVKVEQDSAAQFNTGRLNFTSPLQVSQNTTTSAADISINISDAIFPIKEKVQVNAGAPPSDITISVLSESICLYTGDATNDFNINVRGNPTTTFNNILDTGRSTTVSVLVKNGTTTTPYNIVNFKIDGTSQTVLWQFGQGGGVVPTINSECTTIFTFYIIKTGNSVYTVLGSSVKFA